MLSEIAVNDGQTLPTFSPENFGLENTSPSAMLYRLTGGAATPLTRTRARIGFKATRTGGLREGSPKAPRRLEGCLE